MFLASCGLAMDSAAKLERGQEAFNNGEYRAAIIDAKAVLQEEPDNRDARLLLGRSAVIVGDGAYSRRYAPHDLRRKVIITSGLSASVACSSWCAPIRISRGLEPSGGPRMPASCN